MDEQQFQEKFKQLFNENFSSLISLGFERTEAAALALAKAKDFLKTIEVNDEEDVISITKEQLAYLIVEENFIEVIF